MLHQVEAGLSGVVAQGAVVDARLRAVRAVLLLQVLWDGTGERAQMLHGVWRHDSHSYASFPSFQQCFQELYKNIWGYFDETSDAELSSNGYQSLLFNSQSI